VKAKLKDDDAEIAALEKKLGLKGKKNRPKVFDDDGLRDLLDGLDDYVDGMSAKRKRTDYDEFLSGKRRHVEGSETVSEDDSNQDDATFSEDGKPAGDSESEADGNLDVDDEELDGSLSDEDDEFGGFDDVVNNGLRDTFVDSNPDHLHEDTEEEPPPPKRRENPYVAPVAASIAPSGKYIPPSMRGASTSETEELFRLRRQLQGQLNRLSEANLISILREVEGVYASHARQHVTEVLIDLLIGLLCDRTTLIDTFIILHAGFAAATYKVLGAHFGAQLLERIVSEFEKFYAAEKDEISGSKQTTNLMALLAELYTFQLIGSNLIFDYIRLFLTDLTELNTELLLKIIKNCGAQLRHDDPSSLKDIVIMLQKSVAKVGEANLPVRTKFMIEAIGDLKNNRQKTGVAASSVAAEHIARMKKTLGALNTNIKASEPLGVSLADINSSSKEGKWWLVGASWKNETQESGTSSTPARNGAEDERQDEPGATGDGDDLLQLAKEQRMNTDIRRAIFMNIMSASDYKDAHMRLTKLKLKKSQDLEIPRVLIHCAGTEQGYNPYYTLIAKRLCTEHRFKWAMQFGLWDLFKRMGEKSNNEDDSDIEIDDETDETIDLRKIVNLGRMYGQLVADDALSLTSLKVRGRFANSLYDWFIEFMLTSTL
jgi:nucleolar MIF4G domain-containing protein 1